MIVSNCYFFLTSCSKYGPKLLTMMLKSNVATTSISSRISFYHTLKNQRHSTFIFITLGQKFSFHPLCVFSSKNGLKTLLLSSDFL